MSLNERMKKHWILDRADELLDEKNAFQDKMLEKLGRVDFNYTDQAIVFLILKIAELEHKINEL